MGRAIKCQVGVDVWLCGVCHKWRIVGRPCACGRTYADELCEKAKKVDGAKNAQTTRKKTRPPKSETQFTKSYFFPKKEGEK